MQGNPPHPLSHLPASSAEPASALAYLVLLRMEVAAFHPGLRRTRLCGPVRHVAVPGSYPASRSAEPGLSSALARSGCLADSRLRFYRERRRVITGRKEASMRRRLFFILPDVQSAQRTADDLLLARIEDRHMRFLARRGTPLEPLHEAGYLDKTDMVHGAMVGLALGGIIGTLLGALVVAYPPEGTHPKLVTVLIGMLVGPPLGAWMES